MKTYTTETSDLFENLKRMTRWFNKKDLTQDQLEAWEGQIGKIPSKILYGLVDQAINSKRFMPTPGEIKELFAEFRKYNPEMFLISEQGLKSCDVCHSFGRIPCWKDTVDFPYEYDIPCGYCNNWKRVFTTQPSGPPSNYIPARPMKFEDIKKAGLVIDNPWIDKVREPGKYSGITDMAEAVGSKREEGGLW